MPLIILPIKTAPARDPSVRKICRIHELLSLLVPPLPATGRTGMETWVPELELEAGIHQEQTTRFLHLTVRVDRYPERDFYACQVSPIDDPAERAHICCLAIDREGKRIDASFSMRARVRAVLDPNRLIKVDSIEVSVTVCPKSGDFHPQRRSPNPETCCEYQINTFLTFLEGLPADCFHLPKEGES